MRPFTRCIHFLTSLAMLLTACSSMRFAHTEPRLPVFVVTGFWQEDEAARITLNQDVRRAVTERLIEQRYGQALSPAVDEDKQKSRDPETLRALLARHPTATHVLGGSLRYKDDASGYQVLLWLIDTAQIQTVKSAAEFVPTVAYDFTRSAGAEALPRLALPVLDKLILKAFLPEPRSFPRATWTFRRGLATGLALGLTTAGLSAGIGVATGERYGTNALDTVGHAGWVLAGIGLAGAVLSMTPQLSPILDGDHSNTTRSSIGPRATAYGITTGALSSLLLTSLISTAGFASTTSLPCTKTLTNDSVCNFDKQLQASAGTALAWGVGLALIGTIPQLIGK